MTDGLPATMEMGRLKMLDMFFYYDYPLLFSCVNENQEMYVGILVKEDEWLYAAATEERIQELKDGKITIRAAFVEASSGYVFRVRIPEDGSAIGVSKVEVQELADEDLPSEDARL